METVAILHVAQDGHTAFDVTSSQAVDRLRALGHRTETYVGRKYSFPGSIRAEAQGRFKAMVAWAESRADTGLIDLDMVRRRSVPIPYLDWSITNIVGDGLCIDVLVTHKLRFRVAEGGVTAEIVIGDDLSRHLAAMASVCEASGFDTVRDETFHRVQSMARGDD